MMRVEIPSRGRWIPLLLAAAGLCSLNAGEPAALQTPPASTKTSFNYYKLLQTRNIFSPDRRAMPAPHAGPVAGSDMKPVTRADYVALTGIMVTDGKSLAFFAGSRPEYNKVLTVQGTMASGTITKITPSNIEVERNGKTIAVAVGQTLPFDDSAPAAAPKTVAQEPATAPATESSPGPSGNTPSPASTPAPDPSDIMRRMMEKRQQELQ